MGRESPRNHSKQESGSITLIQVVFAMTLGLGLVMFALSLRDSAKLAYNYDKCTVEYQDLVGLADPDFAGRGACAAFAGTSSPAGGSTSSPASSPPSSPPPPSSPAGTSSDPGSSSVSSDSGSSSSEAPTPTPQPTTTATPVPTGTATPAPTNTATPVATNTSLPTNTALPTATSIPPTVTPIPTGTATLVPTITHTNTLAPTYTNTPAPPTPTRTITPTFPTRTPTRTPTKTNTPFGGGTGCFTGDTQILMDDGSLKRIDQVKVGEMVLSYPDTPRFALEKSSIQTTKENEFFKGLAPKRVSKTFVHQNTEVLRLKTDGPEIDTTEIHPFYVLGRGWTKAGELKIGDILLTLNGKEYTILEKEILPNRQTVYNIEVDDYHTFFVGDDVVWVHNKCCECEPPDRGCPSVE